MACATVTLGPFTTPRIHFVVSLRLPAVGISLIPPFTDRYLGRVAVDFACYVACTSWAIILDAVTTDSSAPLERIYREWKRARMCHSD